MKNFNLNSFGFLRVASVSTECKVADVQFNVEYIIKQIEIAAKSNCQIVLFIRINRLEPTFINNSGIWKPIIAIRMDTLKK